MKIHFIGIGGIGISGLAQYMKFRGHEVSGSDIADSLITKKLRDLGIKVTVPHSSDAITDRELVVHSAIIRPDNPEVLAAIAKKIEMEIHHILKQWDFQDGNLRGEWFNNYAHEKHDDNGLFAAIEINEIVQFYDSEFVYVPDSQVEPYIYHEDTFMTKICQQFFPLASIQYLDRMNSRCQLCSL